MKPTPRSERRVFRTPAVVFATTVALLLIGAVPVFAADFLEDLARIDHALRKNPGHAPQAALASCESRRNSAYRLYASGHLARANRSLKFCWNVLGLSEVEVKEVLADTTPNMAEIQARAASEVEQALGLPPNIENGLRIYRECAACHSPEGWGLQDGMVPQLAGQHHTVVIKQLADIRAGNRDNFLMVPYSSVESIGGTQAVSDVAGYIDILEISIDNGKGPGEDLELGARLYRENCVQCHDAAGEGNAEKFIPRIQAQHYNYLVRQFESIRDGTRRNANPEMAAQIQGFGDRDTHAVLDYVSRLEPAEDLQAPPGWKNPDFAK